MHTAPNESKPRITPVELSRLTDAAELEHTSISSFMVAAAAEKADRVIAEHLTTVLPAALLMTC